MKLQEKILIPALALALILCAGASQPLEPVRSVDGAHWTLWSTDNKLAYLEGMCNYADFVDQPRYRAKKITNFAFPKY